MQNALEKHEIIKLNIDGVLVGRSMNTISDHGDAVCNRHLVCLCRSALESVESRGQTKYGYREMKEAGGSQDVQVRLSSIGIFALPDMADSFIINHGLGQVLLTSRGSDCVF